MNNLQEEMWQLRRALLETKNEVNEYQKYLQYIGVGFGVFCLGGIVGGFFVRKRMATDANRIQQLSSQVQHIDLMKAQFSDQLREAQHKKDHDVKLVESRLISPKYLC
jgi:hypothetical protein